ncbi:hypothetical protein OFO07_02235 [Campylobacter sp. JMF_06 NA1]|nr:hypothetical protein [Campylobacter sp. JMF_06 NA1]MDA3077743.1 hypothetical protein [Campylobacter sp. JMF_06 NA1]
MRASETSVEIYELELPKHKIAVIARSKATKQSTNLNYQTQNL